MGIKYKISVDYNPFAKKRIQFMDKSSKYSKHLIVLAHGILRNSKDMTFLENGLKNEGYSTLSVNLPLTFGTLDDAYRSFKKQIIRELKYYKTVHFVGYSMGGLVIQKFLSMTKLHNLGSCVFIATPHRGSKLADIAILFPGVAMVFQPLKDLKTNRKLDNVFKTNEKLRVGIIAGNKNNIFYSRLFMSSNSDGMVELNSTKLNTMHDFVEFPYGHKNIHFKEDVLAATIKFLNTGKFK